MTYTIPSYKIQPGTAYQPSGQYILDRIPGAVAAWSTRRLISTAPASIARGRDATTNEEDFTAAELAGSGFTTLAGAGDGFYVTLYDQIGSNNATQSTAASQPKGVDTGALIKDGVIPVLDFDGNDFLKTGNSPGFSYSDELSVYFKGDVKLASGNQQLVTIYNTSSNNRSFSLNFQINKLQVWLSSDGTSFNIWQSTADVSVTDYADWSFVFKGGISLELFKNGVEVPGSFTTGSVPAVLYNSAEPLVIGASNGGAGSPINGRISDVIIFNRALSAVEISQLHSALV